MPLHHRVPVLRPAAVTLLSSLTLAAAAPLAADAQSALAAPASGGQASAQGAGAVERVRVRSAPERALIGRYVSLRGSLSSGRRGRPVLLQLRTSRGWRTVERARAGRGGAFRLS